MTHLKKSFLVVVFLLSSFSFSLAGSYSWPTEYSIIGADIGCWEDITHHGQWVLEDNLPYYNYCQVGYGAYPSGTFSAYASTFYGIGMQPLNSSNLCQKTTFTSTSCGSDCAGGYVLLNLTHEAYDLGYSLDFKQISGQTWQFYLKTKRVNGWVDPNMTGFYGYTLTNTVFEDRNITGTVAAYIQKEDGSWMFLKNLQYLFSPSEEGIDFKCNSYKFEYVLDETPCGPQTYTLIKNKEKLFNARLDQPTFYQPVNFVPQVGRVVSNYSVNGLPSGWFYACIYDGLTDAGLGCLPSSFPEFTTDQSLSLSSPYYSYYWDSSWNIYGPVFVTLNLLTSAPAPITWLEYYLNDDWNDYLGGWGPGEPYLDKMLLDTYLGPSINGFIGYGTDYDQWFEPLTVNALDEIVCSPTITQSYYYNKASCVYTEVAPVLESDGTHSFYPGEMCAGSPGVEVWYQTCSGAVKYLYMEGAYETNCRALGHYSEGVYSKASGGKQNMMGHQFRGGYEKRIPVP